MPEWNFLSLVLMLIAPAGLYLVAHLVFPEPMADTDIREYYYGPMHSMWWLAAIIAVASTLFRPVAFGSALVTWDNAASLCLVLGFVALASSRSVLLHSVIVPTFVVLLLWDIVRWHPTIRPV